MRSNQFGFSGAALVALMAVMAFAGCGGGDGASQEELDRARAEGAKEAQDKARVNQLQRQVNQLQREQNRPSRPSRNSGSPAPAPGSSMSPAKICSGGIGASSATSCDFAYNVAGEYGSNPGASTINAYSPVTGRQYLMSCVPMSGWSAVCSGGSGAAVFIP